ncbi:hypothetical protein BRARA_G01134 [Brassica rapa]|uniref:GRF-type domain-containing protein n=1 Tax=Brassica campestris TaxID=3711 RepID=A0A397YJZ9_BRACM|nr:uncharacterized protein At4g04775-like [Brassica napus]RID53759.1 hypothetical protein BRARA_G01134 [Brassica rapa]
MSNLTGDSTAASSRRGRGRVSGVPSQCWCGVAVVEKISKSDFNPYRRYYRCSYAASHKLENDNHVFKWVDEAFLNEIDKLGAQLKKIEQTMEKIDQGREEFEKMMFESVQMKLEKEIFERVEDALLESKANMKKMIIGGVIGCMLMIGLVKLVG